MKAGFSWTVTVSCQEGMFSRSLRIGEMEVHTFSVSLGHT